MAAALLLIDMAKQRYIYREGKDGKVRRIRTNVSALREDVTMLSFEKRMLKSYYDLECEQGSRFRPDYGNHSADQIKKAWSKPVMTERAANV